MAPPIIISATDTMPMAAPISVLTLDLISPWQAKATASQKVRQDITAMAHHGRHRHSSPWTNALHTVWG